MPYNINAKTLGHNSQVICGSVSHRHHQDKLPLLDELPSEDRSHVRLPSSRGGLDISLEVSFHTKCLFYLAQCENISDQGDPATFLLLVQGLHGVWEDVGLKLYQLDGRICCWLENLGNTLWTEITKYK